MTIDELLKKTIQNSASDLHIVSGYAPTIRVHGALLILSEYPVLTGAISENILMPMLNAEQKVELTKHHELDFSYAVDNTRFRVNIYLAEQKLSASFRLIPERISNLAELNMPNSFYNLAKLRQGFILVTGPTGEGKSTTIAAIVNEINLKSARHIITIEDPIEYVYPKAASLISQRELHRDTRNWPVALRAALREDPDVVVIGEMRDFETITAALTIAETGHLVFSTLHTNSAAQTIDRIVDVFPSSQQNQVRLQLSSVLSAIITQRLVPTKEGNGRIPACEVLTNTTATASVIREGKTHLIDNIIETGSDADMILLEKYLFMLLKSGKITKEAAYQYAIRHSTMEKLIEG